MLRLVLDTNIWLDWLVFDDPGIKPLQAAVAAGDAEIVINVDCETELLRVLGYPLQKWTLNTDRQTACINVCRSVARKVETPCTITLPACADADDQKFLELAAGADAHYLLSKDRALLVLAQRRPPLPFHIVTPEVFAAHQGVESSDRATPRAV
jgi:putative PIN family toxin of toxin-antitoxin system